MKPDEPVAWHDRVAAAKPPDVIWHATTPKRLGRYCYTGRILPPVRGFDTEEAAREWGRTAGRKVIVMVVCRGPAWPLPDHHQAEGLAWWTLDGSTWAVVP